MNLSIYFIFQYKEAFQIFLLSRDNNLIESVDSVDSFYL